MFQLSFAADCLLFGVLFSTQKLRLSHQKSKRLNRMKNSVLLLISLLVVGDFLLHSTVAAAMPAHRPSQTKKTALKQHQEHTNGKPGLKASTWNAFNDLQNANRHSFFRRIIVDSDSKDSIIEYAKFSLLNCWNPKPAKEIFFVPLKVCFKFINERFLYRDFKDPKKIFDGTCIQEKGVWTQKSALASDLGSKSPPNFEC